MSDFNSSLPVRTENAGDVIAKIADATTPSQQLAVDASGKIYAKLNDGAGNDITSQTNGAQRALDVGIDVAGIQIDPRSIRLLTASDIVTAQQGTSPWITKDQSDGPVTPGAVASFSGLMGGQYNTVLPTLTTGQQSAVQVDSSGRLLVTTVSTDDHNYGTVGANTLRTAAQIGNATGAADFGAGTTTAQTLRTAANNYDGAGNALTSQANGGQRALDVGIDVAGVQIDPRQIRLLTASDIVTAQQGTSPWVTKDQADGPVTPGTVASFSILIGGQFNTTLPTLTTGQQGALQTDNRGRLLVSTTTNDDHNYGTVGANTLRTAAQIGNATGAADFNAGATGAQTLRVVSNIMDATGTAFSLTNPLPVKVVGGGTPISDYKRAVAIAAGASDTHDYTVTAAKTLYLGQVESSGSGKMKMKLSIETAAASGVFTDKLVQFNSTATPNASFLCQDPIIVATGVRVRVILTNLDLVAQDMYSTIIGAEFT